MTIDAILNLGPVMPVIVIDEADKKSRWRSLTIRRHPHSRDYLAHSGCPCRDTGNGHTLPGDHCWGRDCPHGSAGPAGGRCGVAVRGQPGHHIFGCVWLC